MADSELFQMYNWIDISCEKFCEYTICLWYDSGLQSIIIPLKPESKNMHMSLPFTRMIRFVLAVLELLVY